MYELHYLLATTKVRDAMKTRLITTTPDAPVEEAAMIMMDNNIGCRPVVEKESLVGIISDRDIYRVLVDITGVRHGGRRVFVTGNVNRPGPQPLGAPTWPPTVGPVRFGDLLLLGGSDGVLRAVAQ